MGKYSSHSVATYSFLCETTELESTLKLFWEIESVPAVCILS